MNDQTNLINFDTPEFKSAMECAKRGYDFLSKRYNGNWQPLIDIRHLMLADGSMCILGQLPLDEMARLQQINQYGFTEKIAAVYAESIGIDITTFEPEERYILDPDDSQYRLELFAQEHHQQIDDFAFEHGFMAHSKGYSYDPRYPHTYDDLDVAWRILLENKPSKEMA